MEGESKWSKSNRKKTPDSANQTSEKFKSLQRKYANRNSSISITKKKLANEYNSSKNN